MKLKQLTKAQLETIATEEYGLALDGLDTKGKIIAAIGEEEIDDELFRNYFPPVVVQQGNPQGTPQVVKQLSAAEQLAQLDTLAADIAAKAEKEKARLLELQAETSPYIGEPIDAPVLITDLVGNGTVEANYRGRKVLMEMITVSGIAFPETHKIPCNIRTNVEWLRSYKLEKGATIDARIGIYKQSERERQALEIETRRKGTKNPIKASDAIGLVPQAHLIIGSDVTNIFDIIENNAIRKALVGRTVQTATEGTESEPTVAKGNAIKKMLTMYA